MTKLQVKCILAAVLAMGVSVPSLAATINFSNKLGGSYTKTSNWKTKSIPTASDTVSFNLNSAYTITLGSSKTVSRFLVGKDKLVLDLSGGGSLTAKSTANTSCVLGINKNDVARLTVRGGTFNTAQVLLGSSAGSSGSVTINSGGVWKSSGALTLGSKGTGNITITSGGDVYAAALKLGSSSGAKGTATVSGNGSTLNITGGGVLGSTGSATGQLEIRSGARVSFANSLQVRKGGTLNLNGGTLTTGALQKIGPGNILFSSGILNINDSDIQIGSAGPLGAKLTLTGAQTLNVAHSLIVDPGSVLTLNGTHLSADELANSGEILFKSASLGNFAVNSLVNNEGALIRGSASIDSTVNNEGEIRALGADSLVFYGAVNNSADINLVNGGNIQFKGLLTNSGHINSSGVMTAEGGLNNTGDLVFNSGAATIASNLINSDSGTVAVGGTSATFTKAVEHNGSYFSIAKTSVANFNKEVSGSGDFNGGGLINFLSAYNPDSNAGEILRGGKPEESYGHKIIQLANDVIFGSEGVLNLDVFDWNNYDELNVDGSIELSQVNINVDPGFDPVFDYSLVLLTADQLTGSIENIHVNGIDPQRYELNLDENTLSIILVPEPSSLLTIGALAGLLLRRRSRQTA